MVDVSAIFPYGVSVDGKVYSCSWARFLSDRALSPDVWRSATNLANVLTGFRASNTSPNKFNESAEGRGDKADS